MDLKVQNQLDKYAMSKGESISIYEEEAKFPRWTKTKSKHYQFSPWKAQLMSLKIVVRGSTKELRNSCPQSEQLPQGKISGMCSMLSCISEEEPKCSVKELMETMEVELGRNYNVALLIKFFSFSCNIEYFCSLRQFVKLLH